MTDFNLAVIGDWHLAYCTAVSFSHAGVKTILKTSSGPWISGTPPCPVREPEFDNLVAEGIDKQTLFSTGNWSGWKAQAWWLAVDTPVDDNDVPQTQVLIDTLEQGLQIARPALLVVSSQVPVGFCQMLEERFEIPVAYVPENLRLGQGIETFFRADRTVIGAELPATAGAVRELMTGFKTEFLMTNLSSAEMVKHATNFFLAMSISYANELARIGQKFNVDPAFVTAALKADKRIGPNAYVKPGLGFAGGTLPRDLRVLQGLGRELNVPTPIVNAVLQVNEQVDDVIVEKIMGLPEAKSGKVLLMGYSYKADVDTVRRSPAERLAKKLKQKSLSVYGIDPMMNGHSLGALPEVLTPLKEFSEVPADCGVYVIVTPRAEFKKIPWPTRTATVFDLYDFYKPSERPAGYKWMSLWT